MFYLKRFIVALVIILASFTMLSSVPFFTDDVYAAQTGVFPGSTCTWEISDDGTLTIKGDGTLPNADNIGNPPRTSDLEAFWPYHQHKDDIKKVVIEGDVKTAENARGMFHGLTNLEEVDLTGLDAKKTYFVHDMFSGCTSLKRITFPGEFLPYQGWRMCQGCTALEEITFGSPDDPFREEDLSRPGNRTPFYQFDGSAGSEAFSGCTSLTTLNMNDGVFHSASIYYVSNLTKSFGAANDKPKTFNMENATVLGEHPSSPPRTMFKVDTLATLNLKGAVIGENNLRTLFHNVKTNFDIQDYDACPMLETLIMTDVTFAPDNPGRQVSAWRMLRGLKGLKVVEMSGARFPDGTYSYYDYATGPDPACYNFEEMFYDCPELETVTMGNTTTRDLNVKGAQRMKNMFGICPELVYLDVSGFGTLPAIQDMNGFLGENSGTAAKKLETLILDNLVNTAIQIRRGSDHPHNTDGRALFTYGDPSANLPALKTVSAKNSEIWFVKDNNQGLPGNELYLAANEGDIYYLTKKKTTFVSDVGPTVNIDTKRNWIDLIKDRDGQSSGSETIPDEGKNINNAEGKHLNKNGAGFLAPGVYTIGDEDWDVEKIDPITTFYRISKIDESTPTVSIDDSKNRITDNAGNLRTNVYSKDEWDTLFDEDGYDRILKNDDGSPVITITYPGAVQGADGSTRNLILKINSIIYKDTDRIKERDDEVRHDPNNYIGDRDDKYSRDILIYDTGMLNYRNYLYDSNGDRAISGGSGTYIDFTIEVEDAVDGSSVLFYMEDLDVPAKQDYKPGIDPTDGARDWHFGDLPFKVEGGYGNTWGSGSEGMILGTGNDIDTLKFAEHTGLERVNGNEIISTGGDPNTAWSAFAVRASATGSGYTWTSGVACDTFLLKQTEPPETLDPVYVMPEALKRVNGVTPSGTYETDYFKFDLKPATDVTAAQDYDGNDEAHSLSNSATAAESDENVTNNGGIIAFKTLKYELPDDKKPMAYIYEITEQDGSTAGDVIKYDSDTKFYIQIVVSPPTTDIEMYQGIKAEIITGIKIGDADIIWDTEDVVTVWSDDAVLVEGETGPDGQQVFKDTQGVKFYRKDGKYYSAEDNSELTPAKHAEVDQKVEYQGATYDVKVDKNGVEYFVDGNGKYRNPNDHEHELIVASAGDYDPATVGNDSPVAVKKKVGSNEVREDVHGVEYYGTYKDLDGNDLTVEDGVFNPNAATDKYVYVNKTADGETVYKHANGREYYVKNGKYYDAATGEELEAKTQGQVDPLPSDKNATTHEVKEEEQKESNTGNEYTVKVDKNGVKYYLNEDNNRYYTPYGTLLEEEAGVFEPASNDPADVFSAEIWVDKAGNRFFKHEGHYYDENDNKLDKLSDGTVDTSEVVDAGTFHNVIKTSEITIIKETDKAGANNKSGIFKFNVRFDNSFEPEYLVYEPASSVTEAEQISEDPNIWQFTVEDGQRMSIMNVPFQTTYEITEVIDPDNNTVNNAFMLTAVDDIAGDRIASGTVKTQKQDGDKYNQELAHKFYNELTEIIVDKTVVKGDKNKDFTFTATMKANGLEPGSNISWGTMDEANNHDFKLADVDDSGEIEDTKTFTLKHGKDIVLVVPKGAYVMIVESEAPNYETTVTIDGQVVPGAEINSAKDGMKVSFSNDLELTEKSETKKVTRTITYTEDTKDGPEVAPVKEQTVSLKKVWYEDVAGNTYDAEGNPIELDKTPWTIDDSDPDNDQSAVTSPDHPKKKSEGWNPDRARVDTWRINLINPKDEVVHVIYTRDTYTDSEETKTITRTITYTEYTPDGKKVSKTVTQKVTLRRSVRTNDRTGEKTYGNWEIKSGDTSAVKSPDKNGWTPDMALVPEWIIDLDNLEDVTIHVIYTPDRGETPGDDSGDGGSSKGTDTGDENNIYIWSLVLIVSILAAAAVAVRRRKSE